MTNIISPDQLRQCVGRIAPLSPDQKKILRPAIAAVRGEIMMQVESFYGQGILPETKDCPEHNGVFDIEVALVYRAYHFASGGMAEIHLIENEMTGNHCIVKQLKPQFLQDDDMRARFKREAVLSRRLLHPGILHADRYKIGRKESLIIYPFVKGFSLLDFATILYKNNIKFSPEKALVVMWHIADILSFLEENQVLHRDLKLDNFMLAPDHDNYVVLLDFGFATDPADIRQLIPKGFCCGHIDYLAPELYPRGSVLADVRSEVFALGVMFIKMFYPELVRLEAQKDFKTFAEDKEAEVLTADLQDGVPDVLQPFTEIMVEREPQKRFAHFSEIKDSCEHLLYYSCCQ